MQENVKHFIPHHAITCAVQGSSPNEDVVSTILLIYNPATACPVHVHSYRCDSPETAQLLQEQLQVEYSKTFLFKFTNCSGPGGLKNGFAPSLSLERAPPN